MLPTTTLAFLTLFSTSHPVGASLFSEHRVPGAPGIRLEHRGEDVLPVLDLPYQQVKANSYDATRDVSASPLARRPTPESWG